MPLCGVSMFMSLVAVCLYNTRVVAPCPCCRCFGKRKMLRLRRASFVRTEDGAGDVCSTLGSQTVSTKLFEQARL
ncbi:hypothetical protein PR002_g32440 [Phytophthora rubi]|uniref:Secreted protein n=1 Tax=Phytophthora rubi TaxID=129364 RepID=A0A6A3G493_9STRA|nr:hypothetical protein PR002_g32440 [Phytophthora rubi]